jgi:hypothetical protein
MNIAEIRAKYPMYDDLSDEQLATAFYNKYYSDMDKGEFFGKIGLNQKQPEVNLTPLTEEQKAKVPTSKQIMNALSTVGAGLRGGAEGIVYGLERPVNAMTLGLYDKINPVKRDMGETEKAIGSGIEFLASLPTSAGILKGVQSLPKIGKVALPVASAAESGARELIDSGDLGESARQATIGGTVGGAVGGLGYLAKKLVPEVLGITTGSGGSSIRQAVDAGKRSSEKFLENLRGKTDPADIVDDAKKALTDMKIAKNTQYANNMKALKESQKELDIVPVIDEIKKVNAEYKVGMFSKAGKETKRALNEINNTVKEFIKTPNVRTVEGFDALKQRLNDITFPAEAKEANRVVRKVANSVKGEIVKQAPEYSKIMKDYTQASDAITELEKTLSLGDKKAVDTSLRKLQSAFRKNVSSNYGKREDLVRQLGGEELADAISGQMLSDVMPRGLVGRLAGIGSVSTGNVLGLPAFSPRVVGESSYYLGKALAKTPKTPYLRLGEE